MNPSLSQASGFSSEDKILNCESRGVFNRVRIADVVKVFCEKTNRILVASLLDRVPCKLAHVAAGQLPHLGGDAVLLHEGLLGEVELEGVVGGDGDVEASGKVVRQGRAVVREEEGVVA